MTRRRVSVLAADVVYVKGIVEASEGLASVFAEQGGELTIAAPYGREPELEELLEDLHMEIGARVGLFEERTSSFGQGGDFVDDV
jgi:hypothetical protein